MSRRLLPITAAALTAVLALSSCTTGGGSGSDAKNAAGSGNGSTSEPTVTVANAKSGKVSANSKLKLSVTNGTFSNVQITDADNKTVVADAGKLSDGSAATDGASASAKSTAAAGGSLESTEETATANPTAASTSDSSATDATTGASDSTTEATAEPTSAGGSGTTWTSDYNLAGSSSYTWKATTVDSDGNQHEATGTVKTTKPKGESSKITPMIQNGQKVGVGTPIIVYFNVVVPDKYKAAIEHRLSVKATDKNGKARKIDGTWAWLPVEDGISRLHYRTKNYWPAYTNVTVNMPLKNVQFSKNLFGNKDTTLKFKVSREQLATGNAKTHRFTVSRDGKKIWNWPASLGRPGAPSYNGPHVVMSKDSYYVMKSTKWNYTTPTHWAVRIQNNGEFVHAAPWSEGEQGYANVSHGCINLSMSHAKKYFDSALYGDPVNITGSSVSLSTSNSDINDWVYSWKAYKKMSALD